MFGATSIFFFVISHSNWVKFIKCSAQRFSMEKNQKAGKGWSFLLLNCWTQHRRFFLSKKTPTKFKKKRHQKLNREFLLVQHLHWIVWHTFSLLKAFHDLWFILSVLSLLAQRTESHSILTEKLQLYQENPREAEKKRTDTKTKNNQDNNIQQPTTHPTNP